MDDFQKHLQESLKDEAFRAEYEAKELRYKVIDILVGLRIQYKLTQAELAKKLGTTQAVVSRIENGSVNVGIDFLQKLATEYNLAIYFSSHSIELLRKIKPSNIFHLQKELDNIAIVNPCYPSYATRDIYQHSGYDFLILVEDVLAKYILENIIDENALYKSKLINILPSGGWENVLKMQDDICKSNLAGVGTKVLSVLDGDVKPDFEQLYKQKGLYTNLTINFLPIHSLEKYLHEKIIVNKDADFFKEIGDRFFKVKSLKEVVDSLIKKNDDKAFYNYLIKNLKEQGIEENVFVQKVCEMIYRKEDMSKLLTFLQKTFQN